MRLDSLTYRCLWKLKRVFRLNPGPNPIIWGEFYQISQTSILLAKSEHNLQPPADIWSQLNDEETENLRNFQREFEVIYAI